MSTDQKTRTLNIDPEVPDSVIENELPAYRAISVRAIFSLVCGAVAIFCWAHPIFYLAAILAVVLGVVAHRAIGQRSDMLTGHGIANAGIALGLIFGLGCGTYTVVQTYVRTRVSERFAHQYEAILQSKSLSELLLYNLHPDARKDKTGEQLLKTLESSKPKDKMMAEQKYGPLLALNKRMKASKDEHIEFVAIEATGEDDSHGTEMPIYSLAVFEVTGPGNQEFPEKRQYALAILKGRLKNKNYEWWVDDIKFPYTPKSYEPVAKAPPGDGHGHAH